MAMGGMLPKAAGGLALRGSQEGAAAGDPFPLGCRRAHSGVIGAAEGARAVELLANTKEPRSMRWYDAGHGLDAAAREDCPGRLAGRLKLRH